MYDATYHRDGSVTYWSVYRQTWAPRATALPAEEWAARGPDERARIEAALYREA